MNTEKMANLVASGPDEPSENDELEAALRAADIGTVETALKLLQQLAADAVRLGRPEAAKGTLAAATAFQAWLRILKEEQA